MERSEGERRPALRGGDQAEADGPKRGRGNTPEEEALT